jgi:hypothetical protein
MQTKSLGREVGMYYYANQNTNDGTKLRARVPLRIHSKTFRTPSEDSLKRGLDMYAPI